MWRCEGPHCFVQKRPRPFVSALQSIAAVEASKKQLLRDFRYRSIFDFCNTIPPKADSSRTSRHDRFVPILEVATAHSITSSARSVDDKDQRSAVNRKFISIGLG